MAEVVYFPRPEQKHKCPKCQYASNKATILVRVTDRTSYKIANSSGPVFVGLFTMPRWTGHDRFYLFKCKNCGGFSADYPHISKEEEKRDSLFGLHCGHCGVWRDLYDSEVSDDKETKITERPGPVRMFFQTVFPTIFSRETGD